MKTSVSDAVAKIRCWHGWMRERDGMIERWEKTINTELDEYFAGKKSGKESILSKRAIVYSLEWLSVGYFSALYMAGKKFGKHALAERIKGKVKDSNEFLSKFFMDLGFGKLKVINSEGPRMVYRLEHCSTCCKMTPVGKQVCFFEAGMIAGVLEAKMGKRVIVQETLCGGLGDECDEFIARVEE